MDAYFIADYPHVQDVNQVDLHLGSDSLEEDTWTAQEAQHDDNPPASLLTLPVEIRLRIYEMAYNATFQHSKLTWNGGLKLCLQGTLSGGTHAVRLSGSPFTLLRVCRRLYTEILSMLPPISLVALQFDDFSEDDMKCWLSLLSDAQASQMRLLEMKGWTSCLLEQPLYADGDKQDGYMTRAKRGLCDRSIKLDLNAFSGQFQAGRFDRIVNQPTLGNGRGRSHREFHKACYLLRVLDGCVERSAPKAHPAGRNSQCGGLDAVEAAIASFVSDDGEVVVDRWRVMALWKAGMGR